MTVGEFLARVSSAELTEWMALCLLENEEAQERELLRRNEAGMARTLASPRRR